MLRERLSRFQEGAALLWYGAEEECVLCGNSAKDTICDRCRHQYFQPELSRCYSCGKLIKKNNVHCKDCEQGKGPKSTTRVTALGHYSGEWKDFIHKVKYKGQPYLLTHIRRFIVDWVIQYLPPPDCIIPVPLHHSRFVQRGFNQAEVLASILSRQLGIRYKEALCRNRDTIPQTSLGRHKRQNNVKGAFTVKKDVELRRQIIWLVDDVITTGTTLDECAQVLKEHGVTNIYGICMAAGIEE